MTGSLVRPRAELGVEERVDLDARVPLQDVEDDRDDLLHKKHLMLAIRERLVLEGKSKEMRPGVGCQRDSEPTSGVG